MDAHRRGLFTWFLIGLIMLAGPYAALADVTGAILGTVRDRSQAIVAGAQISITNVQTNFKQETDFRSGRFVSHPRARRRNVQTDGDGKGFRPFA